jgi:hypothetical protein
MGGGGIPSILRNTIVGLPSENGPRNTVLPTLFSNECTYQGRTQRSLCIREAVLDIKTVCEGWSIQNLDNFICLFLTDMDRPINEGVTSVFR